MYTIHQWNLGGLMVIHTKYFTCSRPWLKTRWIQRKGRQQSENFINCDARWKLVCCESLKQWLTIVVVFVFFFLYKLVKYHMKIDVEVSSAQNFNHSPCFLKAKKLCYQKGQGFVWLTRRERKMWSIEKWRNAKYLVFQRREMRR